jgi:galactonate dehydratase
LKITKIDVKTIGAGWKNWLFARVHTDKDVYGVGEGTLNGFIKTTEAAIRELEHLVLGQDPRNVTALAKRLFDSVSNDGGHVHKVAIAAIETACWDIVGKTAGTPVYQLLGGRVRNSVPGYANGWYRTERTPEAFVGAAATVTAHGFRALKVDPFGTAQGFISDADLSLSRAILVALREALGPEFGILIDVHGRFAEAEAIRVANHLADINLFWWEEPTVDRERETPASAVASRTSVRIATGESFYSPSQFFTLACAGGVGIWQPETMVLGGIGPTLEVAHLARAAGAWIAPHQSGGPIATAVALQFAACVPNFLIQEHFDRFNDAWTSDLVTWRPEIDAETGHLSLPTAAGIGIDYLDEVADEHPYDPSAYLNIFAEGWERRLGSE